MKNANYNLNLQKDNKSKISFWFSNLGEYVKIHYAVILLMFLGFLGATVINFFNVATSKTIASFNLSDFEIGQISDRTIIANKSIPSTDEYPEFIEEGEKIIRKGFAITEESYSKLKKMSEHKEYFDRRSFADSELFLLLLMTLWFLLFAYVPFGRKVLIREIVYQVICFLIVYGLTVFGTKTQIFSSEFSLIIIIPAILFVLMEAILYGQLSAVFFSVLLAFGVFNASSWSNVAFLFVLASCIASSMIVRKIEHRIDMVFVSILLAVINIMLITILAVIFNEKFSNLPVVIFGVAFNGFISGILALGFLTPVELILNTASVFRLMDLTDLNNPLMKKMFSTAMGTANHSIAVSQLAEGACREIGANALVAKVGSYYHDIGKLENSEYFVENHLQGESYDLTPALYTTVIKSHVRKGIEKAEQLRLPQQIIDIIEQHHGNSVISYFYEKAKAENPDVNIEDYSYSGTPPTTKEAAVVMLADTVEAACRTLENPTEERLDSFIKVLINSKMESHQLDYCDLTFKDITKVKNSFVQYLVGYYHNRVKYPNQKDPDSTENKENEAKESKNKNKEIEDKKTNSKEK